VVECEGTQYRVLITRSGKPVSGFYPFPFYIEPLAEPFDGPVMHVPHLREVVRAKTEVGEAPPACGGEQWPFVDLTRFSSWEELCDASTTPPGMSSPRRVGQRIRQLSRDVGPVEFSFDDRDERDFETLMRWKSDQYSRTWHAHRMTVPQLLDFYRDLRRRGLFKVSVVRAGGVLAAGKIGLRMDGRSFWRITVYNPDLSRYSAGSMAEMLTLRACLESGEREYDYLIGAETYKFTFATHVRWVGHVGTEPRAERWRRLGRMHAARLVTRSPALYRHLKNVERSTIELRRRLLTRG
jgi:CelD/BcsL family acetyltransferase involved in cellulose biosynthesis